MYRHLQAETAQGVQTGLHRRCPAKSCIERLTRIGCLARPTSRVPLVVGEAGKTRNVCHAGVKRQPTPYSAAVLHHEIVSVG